MPLKELACPYLSSDNVNRELQENISGVMDETVQSRVCYRFSAWNLCRAWRSYFPAWAEHRSSWCFRAGSCWWVVAIALIEVVVLCIDTSGDLSVRAKCTSSWCVRVRSCVELPPLPRRNFLITYRSGSAPYWLFWRSFERKLYWHYSVRQLWSSIVHKIV